MGKLTPLNNTLRDYSEAATVHGVGYVFSKSLPLVDRVVWGAITLTCLSLAAYWSIVAYGNWQDNLVVTTLKDPAMSVSKLPFPAVTVCSSGLDMEAVKEKLLQDFHSWKREEGKTSVDKEEDKAHLGEYMKIKFEIDDISSKNIFDIIKALSSPDPGKAMQSLSVLERANACFNQQKESDATTSNRKKRMTSKQHQESGRTTNRQKRSSPAQIFPFQHEGEVYARVAVASGSRMTRDVVVDSCKKRGMRPLCRYNNRDGWDEECAEGNLPTQWEGTDFSDIVDILIRMKCNNSVWRCQRISQISDELSDIFFYLKGELQPLDNVDAGQNEVAAMFGSSGLMNCTGCWNVDGVKYTSTDDQPLYAACVQESGQKTLIFQNVSFKFPILLFLLDDFVYY